MNWTKEKPTVPGWYWYADYQGARAEVFEFRIINGDMMAICGTVDESLFAQFMDGEFAGPIPAPTIHPVDAVKDHMAATGREMDPESEKQLRAICDELVPADGRPSYNELVACICGMTLQGGLFRQTRKKDFFGRILKQGERFDTHAVSAYEYTEAILAALKIIDADGFLIGDLPIEEDQVRDRFKNQP